MSLREEYFKQMIAGQKIVEFRKKYQQNRSFVYLYISGTKKSIIGAIRFDEPIIDSPEKIAGSESSSSYKGTLEYLEVKKVGYAIPIQKIFLFKRKVSLVHLRNQFNFTPPQSYFILKDHNGLKEYLSNLEVAEQLSIQKERI